jgi:hypothetical protein
VSPPRMLVCREDSRQKIVCHVQKKVEKHWSILFHAFVPSSKHLLLTDFTELPSLLKINNELHPWGTDCVSCSVGQDIPSFNKTQRFIAAFAGLMNSTVTKTA